MALSSGAPDVMGYTVQVTGVIEGIARCVAAIAALEVGMEAGLKKTADDLADKMKELAPVDLGAMRDSIEVRQVGVNEFAVGPTVEYAQWVEFGGDPHWPPAGKISGWAGRHGMETRPLQEHIAEAGTAAHPFVKPAAESVEIGDVGIFATALLI